MDKKSNLIIIFIITLSIFTNVLYISGRNLEVDASSSESYKEKLIRFHVLANSDEEVDQDLKLKVRDRLIETMSDKFKDSIDIEESREIVKDNIEEMKQIALEEIKENGKDYSVDIKLEAHDFPTKSYGDFTLPAGEYEAVRVLIGEAKGENWWCVMFPPLCFVDENNGVIDKKTDEKLKDILTEEEYKLISRENSKKASNRKMKFKILEILETIKKDLK